MTSVDDITDCGSFFDHVDDFLDVPKDDAGYSRLATSTSLLPPIHYLDTFLTGWSSSSCSSLFPCPDSFFGDSDISAEISVPYDDIVQLEWLSSFVDDSFSGVQNPPPSEFPGKQLSDHRFRTSSPVSVLDSTSSCSAEKSGTVTVVASPSRCSRARSKRARPKTANFWPITVPVSSVAAAYAESESSAESRLVIKTPKGTNSEHEKKTKSKKIKFSLPANGDEPWQPVRKCLHCEITKTPQWRAGPMGPKTLCNACGVRYKLGRLFPEYRPAASPTFHPSVHSNSHKKVVEMRNNVVERACEQQQGRGEVNLSFY